MKVKTVPEPLALSRRTALSSLAALSPLAALYRAATSLKNLAYDRGLVRPKRLWAPVISIGNVSVGGSGKTPLVIHLAGLLERAGIPVDVLSRGYGRVSTATLRVEPGDPDGATRFGDEPLLIAAATGCPVYVGGSRLQAGLLAEQQGARVHLLDDGFQHRKLYRHIDIVVLHRSDFSAKLLPIGRLREPLSALRRASVLVLRAEDREYEAALRNMGLRTPIWFVHRQLVLPEPFERAVAFCGIARPDEFFRSLPAAAVPETRAFRDHHRYSYADILSLVELAREHRASIFVTTEKDLVRLSPVQKASLEAAARLTAATLEIHLEDEAAALTYLRDRLADAADSAVSI